MIMFRTLEYYEDMEIDGVLISSRRGLKGNEGEVLDVIEIIGRKEGFLNGKCGRWAYGRFYDTGKYTYTEAINHWKNKIMPKYGKIEYGQC